MEFTTVMMLINVALLVVVIVFLIALFVYSYRIKQRLLNILTDEKVKGMRATDMEVNVKYVDMYNAQGRSSSLPDYFHEDIYKDLPTDTRLVVLQKDYYNLVIDVIESVLRNKPKMQESYPKLRTLESLSINAYLPCIKAAKFSVDYDHYMKDLNPRTLMALLEKKYSRFATDKQFFVTLTNKTCVKKVHILYFITIATDLYLDFSEEVNNCIYNNECNHKPTNSFNSQGSSCEI